MNARRGSERGLVLTSFSPLRSSERIQSYHSERDRAGESHFSFFRELRAPCDVMPSKKKARGKARRAAKEAKAADEKEEEEEKDGSTNNQESSIEAQMQRLMIENLLSAVCLHGFEVETDEEVELCHDFSTEFDDGYNAKFNSGNNDLPSLFNAGWDAAVAKGKVDEIL